MRSGIIATKLGMSSIFNPDGERITLTMLQVDNCQVVAHKTNDKDGYNSVVLGAKNKKLNKVNKPLRTLFTKADIEPKAKLKEFRVSVNNLLPINSFITVEHFKIGQFVDITGVSQGKGFAGGMKRHNFRGLEASHGVSVSHRSHGSTGGRQDPGKVFKNKKMAGHMGHTQVTTQNLKVINIDSTNNVIMIKGNVPGPKGSYVYINDAIKKNSIKI